MGYSGVHEFPSAPSGDDELLKERERLKGEAFELMSLFARDISPAEKETYLANLSTAEAKKEFQELEPYLQDEVVLINSFSEKDKEILTRHVQEFKKGKREHQGLDEMQVAYDIWCKLQGEQTDVRLAA